MIREDLVDLISEVYHEAGYVVRTEIVRTHMEDWKVVDFNETPNQESMETSRELANMLDVPKGHTLQMVSAYTVGGDYIGDEKTAQHLCDEYGIYPELSEPKLSDPSHKVCSIGFSRKYRKWYGWSHRAIFGFSVGDVVKEGDCCASSGYIQEYIEQHPEADRSLPVGFIAKDIFDAKRMAIAFADSVG